MANESAYKTGGPKIFILNLRNGRKMADAGYSPRATINISKDLRLPHQPRSCTLITIVTCYAVDAQLPQKTGPFGEAK